MAITYGESTNLITLNDEVGAGDSWANAYTVADIYTADKAGTLSLHDRDGITGTDGAPVAVTTALRPADYIVLGGASNDLYITIENWVGTTATIRITGTDRDGAAQTEDIVVTANGTTYTTKWFKTITHTQVTVFTATGFDYELIQGQWGVVTKQAVNAYDISARLYFDAGVYFISKSEFVELKPNPTNPVYTIQAAAGSHIRIGEYDVTNKYSYNGAFWRIYVNSITGDQNTGNRFSGELLIYGSNIWADTASYPKGLHFVAGAKIRLYNSTHYHPSYIWAVDTDIQNVKWDGNGSSYDILVASGPNFNWAGLTTSGCKYGVFFSATTTSAVDLYAATILNSVSYDVYMSSGCNWLIRGINCPTITNVSSIAAGKPGYKICYTFNVLVTDNNMNPLSGVTVTLKDVDGNDAFTPETTGADGKLAAAKIITKYWYRNAAQGGNKDYNDHTLTVAKTGYGNYSTVITIDHQIEDDQIMLDGYRFNDIVDAINDVKGTGFVKDTHSLVDIEAYVDGIEAKTDNLPVSPAPASEYDTEMARITANVATEAKQDITDGKVDVIQTQTDKMHFSGDNIQARVANKGVLNNPPSETISDYKNTETEIKDAIHNYAHKDTYKASSAGDVASAVWDEDLSGHTTPNTAGKIVSTIKKIVSFIRASK